MLRFLGAIALATLLACGKSGGPSKAEKQAREQARASVDRAATLSDELLSQRKAGIAVAVGDVPLRGSNAACGLDFAVLNEQLKRPDARYYEHVEVVDREAIDTALGGFQKEQVKTRIDELRADVENDTVPAHTSREAQRDRAAALSDRGQWKPDVTLIIDYFAEPVLRGEDGDFEHGVLAGRMFAWDYAAGKVACVAAVHVVSAQREVVYGKLDVGKLVANLKRRAAREGVAALVAVGERDVVLSAIGGRGAGAETHGSGVVKTFEAMIDRTCKCRSARCGSRQLDRMIKYAKTAKTTVLTGEQGRALEKGIERAKRCLKKHLR